MTDTTARGARRATRSRRGERGGARTVAVKRSAPVEREPVELPPVMTVSELGDALEANPVDVIKELMKEGIMASLNQQIDYTTAAKIAEELGYETSRQKRPASTCRTSQIDGTCRKIRMQSIAHGEYHHGSRRPRQNQLAGCHSFDKCHHGRAGESPAHRCVSNRSRAVGHLP